MSYFSKLSKMFSSSYKPPAAQGSIEFFNVKTKRKVRMPMSKVTIVHKGGRSMYQAIDPQTGIKMMRFKGKG